MNIDDVVEHKLGEKSAEILCSSGFQNMTFYSYNGLGHYTIPQEMYDVCSWLVRQMGISGYGD
ncbi:putative alpha/Beta hydrolase [Helianthus anomalus]